MQPRHRHAPRPAPAARGHLFAPGAVAGRDHLFASGTVAGRGEPIDPSSLSLRVAVALAQLVDLDDGWPTVAGRVSRAGDRS